MSDFDASRYLTNLRGRDYLEVKWRLLWLRTEHPDAIVETELMKHDGGLALFRARVAIPAGGVATGWGSETADDFEDFIEKAETKALGRALAALGYGTQFCEDFDFSAETSASSGEPASTRPAGSRNERRPRVVDAPVSRPTVVRDRRREGATGPQVKAIYCIARDLALDETDLEARCRERYGHAPAELSKQQASEFIDLLRQPSAEEAAKQEAAQPV